MTTETEALRQRFRKHLGNLNQTIAEIESYNENHAPPGRAITPDHDGILPLYLQRRAAMYAIDCIDNRRPIDTKRYDKLAGD